MNKYPTEWFGEDFYEVPDWPEYRISMTGKILSFYKSPPRLKKACLDIYGYLFVTFSRNGKDFQKKVHRVVLEVFVGPCPPGKQASHLDGNKTNNSVSNLSWQTPKENAAMKYLHGGILYGERNHSMRLRDEEIIIIRQQAASGDFTLRELSDIWKMRGDRLLRIFQGKRRPFMSNGEPWPEEVSSLPLNFIPIYTKNFRDCLKDVESGMRLAEAAAKYGIWPSTIKQWQKKIEIFKRTGRW